MPAAANGLTGVRCRSGRKVVPAVAVRVVAVADAKRS